MTPTKYTRDALFTLVGKSQDLHREVCGFLIGPTEESEQKITIMLKELKELTQEL